jgi:hypothetical protein
MLDIGFLGFVHFTLYYIILKAAIQVLHLYARRNDKTTAAAVSGLFA